MLNRYVPVFSIINAVVNILLIKNSLVTINIYNVCLLLVIKKIAAYMLNIQINKITFDYISKIYKEYIRRKLPINNILHNINNFNKLLHSMISKIPSIIIFISYYYALNGFTKSIFPLVSGITYIVTSLIVRKLLDYEQRNILSYDKKQHVKNIINEVYVNSEHVVLNNTINYEVSRLINAYSDYYNTETPKVWGLVDIIYIVSTFYYGILENYCGTDIGMLLIYSYFINSLKNIIEMCLHNYGINKNLKYSDTLDHTDARINNDSDKSGSNDIITEYSTGRTETDHIALQNVSFSYNEENPIWVLKNVNITIEMGKINIIVARNGWGKTTMIKLLLGLLDHKYGSINYTKDISYIPNTPVIFNSTIKSNVLYGSSCDYTKYWCAFLGLEEWYEENKNKSTGYKGCLLLKGDKKKVQLLHSLNKNCGTIIFDEPSIELDINGIRWLSNVVTKLNMLGRTIIITTHDKRVLSTFSDKNIIYLD